MQAALLRVLQDGEIIRVGGNSPIKVDVRVIAATNKDLAAAVKEGTFRLDLFYRLNIINITIPALRDRKEDIIDLVSHFIRKYRLAFKKNVDFVPKSIIDRLKSHNWPGNVRELENVIQRAVLMSKTNIITDQELLFDLQPEQEKEESYISFVQKLEGLPLKSMISELERDIIINNLSKTNGNVAKTSKNLSIGKTALYDKMKRYGISPKDYA
jgi:Nif-specific regulatory protein